jgi:hypothetical protein
LRFALSSEEMFAKGGATTFDYLRFYYNIISLLDNPAYAALKEETLAWFNQ